MGRHGRQRLDDRSELLILLTFRRWCRHLANRRQAKQNKGTLTYRNMDLAQPTPKMSKIWKSIKEFTGNAKLKDQDLNKSAYSLVSTGDLTEDTIQLWLGLPEEVRLDPALEPFRKIYEKQTETKETQSKKPKKADLSSKTHGDSKRLPLVSSAPILGDNVEKQALAPDIEIWDGKEDRETKEALQASKNFSPSPASVPEHRSKLSKAKQYVKISLLLACWIFFTTSFLLYGEKVETVMNTFIAKGEIKNLPLTLSERDESILVELSGPFLSKQEEINMNISQLEQFNKIMVWVESFEKEATKSAKFHLLKDIDFNVGEQRSTVFKLNRSNGSYFLKINSTEKRTIPFRLSYSTNPLDATTGVIYAMVLLCGLYVLIVFEVINRTMAAALISTLSLSVLAIAGERPPLTQIISWLDAETLLLLFSMMLLVAIMAETGIFDFLAVYTFEVTKGRLWPLIYLLCGITAVLSTFLDNVTTVLLMSPVTIRLCEVMDLNPVPILMFMAMYSNIGGTATPVGDPPCVIVASNKAVIDAGIDFTTFTAHMSLGVLLVFIQTSLQLRYMYRDTNKLRLNEPRDVQDLRHQIQIWRRAANSLPGMSADAAVVKDRLERKIKKLDAKLHQLLKDNSGRACPRQQYSSTLQELKAKYKIRDKVILAKASVAIFFVVALFFLHSLPALNRVSLSWTALLGALLLLLLADREDIEPILHRVEWSTLLFFASLFVLMEALSKLGLIMYVGGLMEQLILKVDESSRLAVAIMLTLWVSGIISALVDNIPLTTMMVRVVVSLGTNPALNLPMGPLVWAMLWGACLGGNGTLIGASANVVCAGVAEQHGYKFTFKEFFRNGFPIMIGHFIVGSGYLMICHCVFEWH